MQKRLHVLFFCNFAPIHASARQNSPKQLKHMYCIERYYNS